jgi:hypothetical protein
MERFSLSEVQANAILEMPLRRLTALEKLKLEEERDELVARIADLEAILGSEQRQRTIVLEGAGRAGRSAGPPRRSTVISADQVDDVSPTEPLPLEIADDPCVVTLSTSGLIGREAPKAGSPSRRSAATTCSSARVETTNHATVFAITDTGRALGVTAMEVPEVAGRNRGANAAEVVDLKHGERVVTLVVPGQRSPAARHPRRRGQAHRRRRARRHQVRRCVIGLKGDDGSWRHCPLPREVRGGHRRPTTPRCCAPRPTDQPAGARRGRGRRHEAPAGRGGRRRRPRPRRLR